MTARWQGGASRLACLTLALVVHAGAVFALVAAKKESPPEPESAIELELTAAVTSEIVPADIESATAAPEQAEEAQEVVAGDAVTMVATEAPAIAEAPPRETPDVDAAVIAKDTPPTNVQAANDQPEPATDVVPAEAQPVAASAPTAPTMTVDAVQSAVPAPDAETIAAAENFVVADEVAPPAGPAPQKPAQARARKVAEPQKFRKTSPAPPMVAGQREQNRATQTGKSSAVRAGGAVLASSYRAVVAARINGRKGAIATRVPPGVTGTVVISFVIGPGGSVSRSAIRRSSGVGAIDAAALSAISSTSFPPPPTGAFAAVVPIRID